MHMHVEKVTAALVQKYDRPTLGNKRNPFNELLYIVLSSRTPPNRYQETYLALRRDFARADDLARVNAARIARSIKCGGLQNKKARAIAGIARTLKERFGRVTLAPLKSVETKEAEQFLTALPGVSIKTARCVLMYALDRPVFPVDRHCLRVAYRLGWVQRGDVLTRQQQDQLQEGVPSSLRKDLHVGMVVLGRRCCTPTDPACGNCPLLEFCPTGQANEEER
jgi:endonuclease III